jgi:hypothetical protein
VFNPGVLKASETSLSAPTSRDRMGAVVDQGDLTGALASKLRFAAGLGVVSGARAAGAARLSGVSMAAEGSVGDLGRRSSVSFGLAREEAVRVLPEDSVPMEALGHGAGDIGREVAARLVHAFRRTRGWPAGAAIMACR